MKNMSEVLKRHFKVGQSMTLRDKSGVKLESNRLTWRALEEAYRLQKINRGSKL